MDSTRINCPMRHENGSCLPCGGSCLAVSNEICRGFRNAYRDGANSWMLKQEPTVSEEKWIPVGERLPMFDTCVFCGAVTDGNLACPNCRHHVENLTPKQRRAFESFERDARARENFRVACQNLRDALLSMSESAAETARKLYKELENRYGK